MAKKKGIPNEASDPKRSTERRQYRTPQLEIYGAVQDLTTGGTGNAAEGAPGAPRKRP